MIEIKEFLPGLYLVEASLEYISVRGVLLKGKDRIVVWDTLSHPDDMKPVLPFLTGETLFSIYSHADWDHVWGTAGLPGNGGIVIGQNACLQRFHTDVPKVLSEMSVERPGLWGGLVLVPPLLTFPQALTLNLGALTLELEHVPGHTRDSVVGFIPELGVLLAGDVIEEPFPLLNETNPLEPWIQALKRWSNDPRLKWVIPAHGAVNGRSLILNNLAYLQSLKDGTTYNLPDGMEEFYREGHQNNLIHARELQ
jgi:glyoxylase-like metal-dependent hydrolase (beta-lactamase superfamily II)